MNYKALLIDYGQVISRPQPADAVTALAGLTGLEQDTFDRRYWATRADYDVDMEPRTYWSQVVGRDLDDEQLRILVDADNASWGHVTPATVDVLRRVRDSGARLVLLSNAPQAFAAAFRRGALASLFDELVFSGEVGVAKPAARIYELAVDAAGVAPSEAYFTDDRAENIDAARAAGIAADVFTGADDLSAALGLGPKA